MTARRSQIAAHAATLILTFGVGILVGQQFCASEAEPEMPEERDCPTEAPEFIEYCPPETLEEPEKETEPPPPPQDIEEASEELPEGPPPATAEQRRQLLGWARAQSTTLEGCSRDRGHTYRLTITLHLSDDDQIESISIDSSDDDLVAELDSCLKERISRWKVPDDLRPTQRQLVFRLTL